jgi:hypothetical protein
MNGILQLAVYESTVIDIHNSNDIESSFSISLSFSRFAAAEAAEGGGVSRWNFFPLLQQQQLCVHVDVSEFIRDFIRL